MAWVCLCGRGRPSGPRSPPRAQATRRRTYGTTWRGQSRAELGRPPGTDAHHPGHEPPVGAPTASRLRPAGLDTGGRLRLELNALEREAPVGVSTAPLAWASPSGQGQPPGTGAHRPGARAARQRIDSSTRRGPTCPAGLGRGEGGGSDGSSPPWGVRRLSAYRQHPLAWAGPAGDGHPGQAHRPGREPPVAVPTAPLHVDRPGPRRRRPPGTRLTAQGASRPSAH